jgi:hypothetical protein
MPTYEDPADHPLGGETTSHVEDPNEVYDQAYAERVAENDAIVPILEVLCAADGVKPEMLHRPDGPKQEARRRYARALVRAGYQTPGVG